MIFRSTIALAAALLSTVQAQDVTPTPVTAAVPTAAPRTCAGPRSAGELRAALLEGYDKYTRPEVARSLNDGYEIHSTPPEMARIQLHVLSLNGVDQKANRYDLSVWLRRTWTDYRLAYQTVSDGGCFSDDGRVGYSDEILKDIWEPDFYIDNQAKPNAKTAASVWIYPNGQVLWVSQLEMTLACQMEFVDFPYDTQKCGFRVGTYLEDARSVQLRFFEDLDPVTLNSETNTEGVLPHGGTTEWTIAEATPVIRNTAGGALYEESFVEIEFDLKRNSEYYTDFVLIPCVMFVCIGWASFWINRSAAPARVAMSMIVFLSNTNFLASQLGQLPRLGNQVWLLQFMSMSQYFTFFCIIEYVVCNYLRRIEARLDGARKKARDNRNAGAVEKQQDLPDFITKEEIMATGFDCKVDLMLLNPKTGRMYVQDEHIDIFSRFAYPLAYICAFLALWFMR